MIRSLYYRQTEVVETDLSVDQFKVALQDPHGLLWVDFEGEPPEACQSILLETFGFHLLAVDDALEETHTPKLDDWGEYLYIVLRGIILDKDADEQVDTPELDVFLGKNYLVTHHDHPITAVDRVWTVCQQDNHRYLKRGSGHLLYRLTDELAAAYVPVVEELDDLIDCIEDQLFDNPAPTALEDIFKLKRTLLHLRRIILPQSEVLNKLARDKYNVIKDKDQIFFRDVYDHFVRLHGLTESMRELVGSAMNTYLSVVNNRMNDVMKTLTIFTALFMPLSFIVGFFGMNFFQAFTPLQVWTGQPAFTLTMTTILLLPAGMVLWIRWRGWM